jgi:hypothetical protein
MIRFQAAASALGAALFPPLIGLAMGVSAGAFAEAIAPLCLIAALLHIAVQMRRSLPDRRMETRRRWLWLSY